MRRIFIAIVAACGLTASPALARDTADDSRCLFVAMAGLGQATEPEQKAQLASAAMFFMGRLDGAKDDELADTIRREARSMRSPQELGSEARRCAGIVQRRAEALREIGQKLNDKAR